MTSGIVVASSALEPLAGAGGPAVNDRHPVVAYLATLSTTAGRRTQRSALDQMAKLIAPDLNALTCPWHLIRYPHAAALRSALVDKGLAPATGNRYLQATRAVLRHSWLLGYMEHEDYARIATLPGIRGSRLPAGRALALDEVQALVGACASDPLPLGARDAAMLATMYHAGPRREEVVRLDLADWARDDQSLRLMGKGNREREVFIPPGCAAVIGTWLSVRGSGPGPLFCRCHWRGRVYPGRRLTSGAVMQVVLKRYQQAGLQRMSPHDLRRTFISDALMEADVLVVQKMAGHSDPRHTSLYDRRGREVQRDVALRMDVEWPAWAGAAGQE